MGVMKTHLLTPELSIGRHFSLKLILSKSTYSIHFEMFIPENLKLLIFISVSVRTCTIHALKKCQLS